MAYPVSSRWEKFIRRGYAPVTRVDIRMPGEGTIFSNLPVSSGSISVSRGNSYRTSGSIVVPDPDLFPAINEDSVLAPYGAEIVINTGIQYPEGTLELIPVGVFPIEDADGSEAAGNVTSISFYDRAKRCENADFIEPKDYGGVLVQEAIEDEVLYAAPFFNDPIEWTVSFDPELENHHLPHGTVLEGNRWAFVTELAESIGADIFFYRDGNVRVVPVPGIYGYAETPEHDWVIDAGADGVLIDLKRSISRDGVFNGVVVTGSADGDREQPWAFVTDDHPDSRTKFGGPFGKSITRIDNSDLTTSEQCRIQALAELRDLTGLQSSVDLDCVGNPAIDVGDIILARGLTGDDEIHMVDGYSFDFATVKMSIDTRSLQFVEES